MRSEFNFAFSEETDEVGLTISVIETML